MTKGQRMFFRILAAVGFVIAGFVVFSAWMMFKRPLAVNDLFSRVALNRAGLSDRHVEVATGRMTVFSGGTGPPMVLLHGAGVQAGNWARVAPTLVADYRLVVPDLAGHGGSDPKNGPISVGTVLAGVREVMDGWVADEPAIVVGNSLGAWVGFLYASEYPKRVARLIAVNGGPVAHASEVNLFPTTRDEARRTVRSLFGPDTPPLPGYVLDDLIRWGRVGPAARLAQTADEMPEFLLDDRLGEVRVPVDLVWGDHDGLFPVSYARRLRDGLPAARLTLVERCGHLPQQECPDRFLDALYEVLDAPPPEPDSPADEVPP